MYALYKSMKETQELTLTHDYQIAFAIHLTGTIKLKMIVNK